MCAASPRAELEAAELGRVLSSAHGLSEPRGAVNSQLRGSPQPSQTQKPKDQEVHRTVVDEHWKYPKLRADG